MAGAIIYLGIVPCACSSRGRGYNIARVLLLFLVLVAGAIIYLGIVSGACSSSGRGYNIARDSTRTIYSTSGKGFITGRITTCTHSSSGRGYNIGGNSFCDSSISGKGYNVPFGTKSTSCYTHTTSSSASAHSSKGYNDVGCGTSST